jgi:hypothetical protein
LVPDYFARNDDNALGLLATISKEGLSPIGAGLEDHRAGEVGVERKFIVGIGEDGQPERKRIRGPSEVILLRHLDAAFWIRPLAGVKAFNDIRLISRRADVHDPRRGRRCGAWRATHGAGKGKKQEKKSIPNSRKRHWFGSLGLPILTSPFRRKSGKKVTTVWRGIANI